MVRELRKACLVVAAVGTASCDPIVTRGVAVSVAPSAASDSVLLAVAAKVASEQGMSRNSHVEGGRWIECYTGPSLSFCSHRVESELQFALMYSGFKWSAYADSVESALVRALSATHGASVRQCDFEHLERNDLYGCELVVVTGQHVVTDPPLGA